LPPALAGLLAAANREAEERAWATFVATYTPLLLHTVHRFGHSYDAAMDRYAYVLEQLHRDQFRRLRRFASAGPGRFTTWLVVVARRLCLDYHRRRYGRSRKPAVGRLDLSQAAVGVRRRLAELISEEIPLTAIVDYSTPDPEAAAQSSERADAVRAALRALEPRDRVLLKLRFERDLPAHAIADVLGFSTQFDVYRRLRVVLALLGKMLPRECLGTSS
jgi:RNA polymerase sigma factor (sigma-70 family)